MTINLKVLILCALICLIGFSIHKHGEASGWRECRDVVVEK